MMVSAPANLSNHPTSTPLSETWRGCFLLLFAALQLADVVTTNHALAAATAVEGNPIMALAITHLGTVWWLPKVAIVAFSMIAVRQIRRRWPFKVVTAILVVLVANNLVYW